MRAGIGSLHRLHSGTLPRREANNEGSGRLPVVTCKEVRSEERRENGEERLRGM